MLLRRILNTINIIDEIRRSTSRILSRLKQIISREPDRLIVQSLIHGYVFDAWSSRKCQDEFLELNTPWTLDTESFLTLISGLDLQNELTSTLLTIQRKECLRLLKLILESTQMHAELLIDLFLWTMDLFKTANSNSVPSQTQRERCAAFVKLWLEHIAVHGHCRTLFRESFRRILNRLVLRMTRGPRGTIGVWQVGQSEVNDGTQCTEEGKVFGVVGSVKEVLQIIVKSFVEDGDGQENFTHDFRQDLEHWDELVPGSGLLGLLPMPQDTVAAPKRRRAEEPDILTREERWAIRHRADMNFAKKRIRAHHSYQECRQTAKTLDDHQIAFVSICNTIRRHQDLPGYPPSYITKLALDKSLLTLDESEILKQHVEWVESTIQGRSTGWRSLVQLKLQFYAVFKESSVNEHFANLICECKLHWELCEVLSRYLKRHRADEKRMPFSTLQLGCELVLSVFVKMERLRTRLRDHLVLLSRSICKDAKDPLFGSWGLWRMNINTLLTSTLNQIVATEDISTSMSTSPSSSVPPQIIESLVKVVEKLVNSATVNRGQCSILLQVLTSLGQLAWLRPGMEGRTIFVAVLRDLLCEPSSEASSWNRLQQENFVEFIMEALSKVSAAGIILLNPTEFLVECVNPLLDIMLAGKANPCFHPVAIIAMKLYDSGNTIPATGANWPSQEIHLRILYQLLQMRDLVSSWNADQFSQGKQIFKHVAINQRRLDGEHAEDVSSLCELMVSRMVAYVCTETALYQVERVKFEAFVKLLHTSTSLESQLMVVPLLIAYRQRLEINVQLPALPSRLWVLCRDQLAVFEYTEVHSSSDEYRDGPDSISVPNTLQAIFLLLGLGRMCDEVLADLVKALNRVKDCLLCLQGDLNLVMAPVLYRVLSISSRSESQRLLVQGVPSLVKLWGQSCDSSIHWDITHDETTALHTLSSYWSSFRLVENRGTEEDANDRLLTLLQMSETLLRFALEPLPVKNKDMMTKVYSLEVGYDMTADQIASLIQSSIKTMQIDWSTLPLDHVLYCFMASCKMSYIVSNQHTNKPYKNRIGLKTGHFMEELTADTATWIQNYSRFMEQHHHDVDQLEQVARSKARDELVLMAMGISEEIVRRQDAYYKTSIENTEKQDRRANERNSGKGACTAHGGDRSKGRGHGGGRKGHSASGHERYQDSDSPASSSAPCVTNGMDEGTQAWLNSIMASVAGSSVRNTSDATPHESQPSQQQELQEHQQKEQKQDSSLLAITAPTVLDTIEPMLNPDQVDCLMLALEYLPMQEQHAVKARLSRLVTEKKQK
ncbi:hypothetical protein BGZ51_004743 [Haplosporangium sp. Z 767]|nr:hypothetical protein BGZ51_004743 [Haplosporangium sp. Z 767]KAF9186098.1 hypothetical protein BGZ50_002651 [Haplosporangium sp. Z 11]